MKIGIRKPSIKKSISARTTGNAKRKLKRVVNPFYGKKGMGFIKNPGKAIKGKIYRKTTISAKSAVKGFGGFLWACCVIPFYIMWYTIVLMWYAMKYIFLAGIWIIVLLINGIMALVEWGINFYNQKNAEPVEKNDTKISMLDSPEVPISGEPVSATDTSSNEEE